MTHDNDISRLTVFSAQILTSWSQVTTFWSLCWLLLLELHIDFRFINSTGLFSQAEVNTYVFCQFLPQVYLRLSEVLGFSDDLPVLGAFVEKILTNLKYWTCQEPILRRTLDLLSELSRGYSAMRKLLRLDGIQFILANHTVSDNGYACFWVFCFRFQSHKSDKM